jgi:ABC-2 type transport system permease protein
MSALTTLRASTRRIIAIAHKEVLHVVRDPRSLYLALGMPIVLLVLFGFGVSFDMEHLPVAVIDEDRSAASRDFIARVFASGELEQVDVEGLDAQHITLAFERRLAIGVLIVPHGFGDDIARGRNQSVQMLLDGVDPNTATQTLTKADAVIRAAGAVLARGPSSTPMRLPVDMRVRTWFNPQSRSALFLVPGLTAYIVAIVSVLLTSLTLAREFERGSMQQLFATPVARFEIILGKLLPYLALGAVVVLMVLTAGAWVFEVPVRGSIPALILASLLFLIGMLAQGLLISIVARSQMVATQMATMTSMLPSMLLSGFMFPIENMPLPLRVISNIVPARYYIHALRGILLRGNGLAEVGPDLLALSIFAFVVLALGTARFPRTLA